MRVSKSNSKTDYSKRAFLRGRAPVATPSLNLPWATAGAIENNCSQCMDRKKACPQNLIVTGDGGYPTVSFASSGCDFCGLCEEACNENVFAKTKDAFGWHAAVSLKCITHSASLCESCRDSSETQAISFKPRIGHAPRPEISIDDCTGYSFCISTCPTNAISLITDEKNLA
jgi:ferredoxin-type protein NapF